MGPNATLEEMLRLSADVLDNEGSAGDEAARLAELVIGLNGWITRGGFIPASWRASAVGVAPR